jgi:hypothetical protein
MGEPQGIRFKGKGCTLQALNGLCEQRGQGQGEEEEPGAGACMHPSLGRQVCNCTWSEARQMGIIQVPQVFFEPLNQTL